MISEQGAGHARGAAWPGYCSDYTPTQRAALACPAWTGAKPSYTCLQASKSDTPCRTTATVLITTPLSGWLPCCEKTASGEAPQRADAFESTHLLQELEPWDVRA